MQKLIIVLILIVLIAFFLISRREPFGYYSDQYLKTDCLADAGINYPQPVKYTTDPLYRYDDINPVIYDVNYVDILNALNRLAPTGKQIFNIFNKSYQTEHDIDINKVEEILDGIIKQINEEASPATSSANQAGIYTVTQAAPDGFKDVMLKIGFPPSLYPGVQTKSTQKSPISLKEFSDITRRETSEELQYEVIMTIQRQGIDTLMVIKAKFVINKKAMNTVIFEAFYVVGYVVNRFLGKKYQEVDGFYNFDTFPGINGNIAQYGETENIIKELNKKEKARAEMMQSMINNLDPISKSMYQKFDPRNYQSYKDTQTIYDELIGADSYNRAAGTESVRITN